MSNCGVKFVAYPTKKQAQILSQWIGCARVIYNCKVQEDNDNYNEFKKTGVKLRANQAYSRFKTDDKSWLNDCPSQILRNSSSNWYASKQRFFKGLSQNPKKKKKGIKDTVLLTNELFLFKDKMNDDGSVSKKIFIGTKLNNIGYLKFYAHREFGIPKQIVIGKKNDQWNVSFCYEADEIEKTAEELLEEYSLLDKESLTELTTGIDRGIVIPFQTSQSNLFDFDEKTKIKLHKKQNRLKKYQKRMSHQKKGSNTRNRTKAKVSKLHRKIYNIRHDFCHKTSHSLVTSEARIFSVEDLKIKNMTKAPEPKQDEKTKKYLPNKKRAKAGLNREMLSKGLSKTIDFLEYKAGKYRKVVVKVSPHYSSQECACCGHIHPDNRKTQNNFTCLLCGHHDNADLNAAKIIAKRGVLYILSRPNAKIKTRLGISRSKAGRGISKTKLDFSNAQIPMTPEALAL